MAPFHVRCVGTSCIGTICLGVALMSAAPAPARATTIIQGTVDVQPDFIANAEDTICVQDGVDFPPCGSALITFSLHLDRPSTFQYSFTWNAPPPCNVGMICQVMGDSDFIKQVEQGLGKPEFLTQNFSNSWDGTNLAVDLEIHASGFPQDAYISADQQMGFNTAPGSSGHWAESVVDNFEFGLFSQFTTTSSDLTVVIPEPPPLLIMLPALAAFFGVAGLRRLVTKHAAPS